MIFFEMVHNGEPRTKSNALFATFKKGRRNNKCRFFVPGDIKAYEEGLTEHAQEVMGKRSPTSKLVRMTIHYYYKAKRRKDIQNLAKTQCDALNKVVYEDDSQIHEICQFKHWDKTNPRVHIVIEEMSDSHWESKEKPKKKKTRP